MKIIGSIYINISVNYAHNLNFKFNISAVIEPLKLSLDINLFLITS